jgi:ABC-2 type transport system permease protein
MSTDARLIDTSFTRYDGPRSGRAAAIWSLARWSTLRALGARRGWKVKVIPISLTLLAFAPALVVLGLRALFGTSSFTKAVIRAVPYGNYVSLVSVIVLAFTVVITPELVCPDRRDRTLSLYFSTALSRFDYLAGKILAALLPLLLVTLAPVALLYGGSVLFAVHPLGYIQHTWRMIPRIIAGGLIVAMFYALVGLAISSLTSRRAFAVGGYLAFLALPTIIGGVLSHALNHPDLHLLAIAPSPIIAAQGLYPNYSSPGNLSAVTWGSVAVEVSVAALAVLAYRYGRAED